MDFKSSCKKGEVGLNLCKIKKVVLFLCSKSKYVC